MSEQLTLELKRTIKARRDRVFAAWTQPELLSRWFAPGPMTVVSAQTDVRSGGTYRIAMAGNNGNGKCINAAVAGTYLQVIPNELLSFTWGWPGDPAPETLVTVAFKDAGDGLTQISITQGRFAERSELDRHQHGWLGCFDNLEKFAKSEEIDASDFSKRIWLKASCERVFDSISTPEGIRDWWTTLVSGDPHVGGELTLRFEGLNEQIVLRVNEAVRPSRLQWTCLIHTDLPEWTNTRIVFTLSELGNGGCELLLKHHGLTPRLACFEHCSVGWDRFLTSLKLLVEEGKGQPFGVQRIQACVSLQQQ